MAFGSTFGSFGSGGGFGGVGSGGSSAGGSSSGRLPNPFGTGTTGGFASQQQQPAAAYKPGDYQWSGGAPPTLDSGRWINDTGQWRDKWAMGTTPESGWRPRPYNPADGGNPTPPNGLTAPPPPGTDTDTSSSFADALKGLFGNLGGGGGGGGQVGIQIPQGPGLSAGQQAMLAGDRDLYLALNRGGTGPNNFGQVTGGGSQLGYANPFAEKYGLSNFDQWAAANNYQFAPADGSLPKDEQLRRSNEQQIMRNQAGTEYMNWLVPQLRAKLQGYADSAQAQQDAQRRAAETASTTGIVLPYPR